MFCINVQEASVPKKTTSVTISPSEEGQLEIRLVSGIDGELITWTT